MAVHGIRAYGLLRDSEEDPKTRYILNQQVAECWSSLARINANNGKYLFALAYELEALITDFSWNQFLKSFKGIARNFAMAIGIHTPRDED
jgi:hypothetical protein